jgi:hypothetical protein
VSGGFDETRVAKARRAYGYRWSDWLRWTDAHPIDDPELAVFWIEWLRDEIERMQELVDELKRDVDQRSVAQRRREKIRQLREGTNGRTDAEIETGKRLADRLEAKAKESPTS